MLKTQSTIGDVYVGKIQRVKPESKMGSSSSGSSYRSRCRNLGITIATGACLVGCGTIKKAGIVATGAAIGATAGTVFSGGAIAPIAGAMTTAFVTDVATAGMGSSRTTMADGTCAPDNFFTLLGSLAEMGGWLLILVVVIPMVLGWFLPGPVKMKGREPKHPNPYLR
jgi:hypothetical protein